MNGTAREGQLGDDSLMCSWMIPPFLAAGAANATIGSTASAYGIDDLVNQGYLGVSGETWQEVIETAMGIPPEARNELRAKWEEHVHEVLDQGGTPDVLAFTHALVDVTFGIEPVGD